MNALKHYSIHPSVIDQSSQVSEQQSNTTSARLIFFSIKLTFAFSSTRFFGAFLAEQYILHKEIGTLFARNTLAQHLSWETQCTALQTDGETDDNTVYYYDRLKMTTWYLSSVERIYVKSLRHTVSHPYRN